MRSATRLRVVVCLVIAATTIVVMLKMIEMVIAVVTVSAMFIVM